MGNKIFVDTDVVLDLLARREPYYVPAARLFTLADQSKVQLYVSSLSFSNLHYLLTKQYSREGSLKILRDFKVLVKVVGVDDKIIGLALNSAFTDFEDAIQYYAALEENVSVLVTRNLRDYKEAGIPVLTAEGYLATR